MPRPDWQAAIAAWRSEGVGAEHVRDDAGGIAPYRRNVGGLDRAIPCVVRPADADEVQRVLRIANRFGTPLHPVSRGRNWGLGSRLPPRDGTAVLDLSRMDRIREVHVAHHYAVVEPGVTQGALYDHLRARGLPLALNVTGSSRDSSLIGNCLDRGVGYFAPRAEALSGLEVVLGSGERVELGFAHRAGTRTRYLFRHGVGPSLDGLFHQSAFGVVTAAAFDLIPEPEAHAAVIARLDRAEALAGLIDAFARLRRDGALASVVHIGNRERSRITLTPLLEGVLRGRGSGESASALLARAGFGPWSAVGGILGTGAGVAVSLRAIRRALRGLARVTVLNDRRIALARRLGRAGRAIPYVRDQAALLEAMRPLYELTRGIPSDAALPSVTWPLGLPAAANPDDSAAGLLYCLPILPAEGGFTAPLVAQAERTLAAAGFPPAITLNLLDDRALECVLGIAFRRDDAAHAGAAREALARTRALFDAHGCPSYRAGLEAMEEVVDPANPFWRTVAGLKRVLDPNGILSPGRYGA